MFLLVGSIVIAAFQLVAAFTISQKWTWGWLISIFTCTIAIPYDLHTDQPGFIVTSIVSGSIAIRAYIRWRKEDKRDTDQSATRSPDGPLYPKQASTGDPES